MIIFLHGSDSYRSRQKLNALIEQFKKTRDPRGDNVVRIDGSKTDLDEINSKIASASLLAEKRMLIIEDLFSHKEKNIFKLLLEYLQKIKEEDNSNVLVFREERELDTKKFGEKKLLVDQKKLFDFLAKQEFSEKFIPLNNLQLINWIKKRIAAEEITASPKILNLFTISTGNDLWLINNELDKIISYVKSHKKNEISEEDIRTLVRGNIDENIFALTDSVSNKNKALFFPLLEQQLESGVSIQQILTMITRQFKIIIQVKELLLQNTNQKDIASQLKLHPFVVQKTTPQTRNFSIEQLKKILNGLIEIDYKIKTGQADGLTGLNILFV